MSGLEGGTIYYVRAYAVNSVGTAYGNQEYFSTDVINIPSVTTDNIVNITQTTAVGGGNVTNDGGSTVTSRGICYSTSQNPTTSNFTVTSGSGAGAFTANMSGLEPGTIYYLKAYASNIEGTAYGEEVLFETKYDNTGIPCNGVSTIVDIDFNTYQIIQIGNQCWMKNNLKTTKYRDGTSIEYPGSDNAAWESNTTGAYSWHNNDINFKQELGALYNGYAVHNSKGLCPNGWHIPSIDEFQELFNYLDGQNNAGGALKSTRTFPDPFPYWNYPNLGATNSNGFTGYSAGLRYPYGDFDILGVLTHYWTSSNDSNPSFGYFILLHRNSSAASSTYANKSFGHSVRCIKD
jgi:uncharacterized protein (TIGR02145 family)